MKMTWNDLKITWRDKDVKWRWHWKVCSSFKWNSTLTNVPEPMSYRDRWIDHVLAWLFRSFISITSFKIRIKRVNNINNSLIWSMKPHRGLWIDLVLIYVFPYFWYEHERRTKNCGRVVRWWITWLTYPFNIKGRFNYTKDVFVVNCGCIAVWMFKYHDQ